MQMRKVWFGIQAWSLAGTPSLKFGLDSSSVKFDLASKTSSWLGIQVQRVACTPRLELDLGFKRDALLVSKPQVWLEIKREAWILPSLKFGMDYPSLKFGFESNRGAWLEL